MPFRRGLLRAVGRATGLKGESCHYGEEEAAEVVEALSLLKFDPKVEVEAIRLLIFDACAVLGESTVAARLGESWAASILRLMQEYHAVQLERKRRHEEFNSVEAAEARKRAKDEAREQRLAKRSLRKAEIDALWRTLNL
jgi:hypothetical protein